MGFYEFLVITTNQKKKKKKKTRGREWKKANIMEVVLNPYQQKEIVEGAP